MKGNHKNQSLLVLDPLATRLWFAFSDILGGDNKVFPLLKRLWSHDVTRLSGRLCRLKEVVENYTYSNFCGKLILELLEEKYWFSEGASLLTMKEIEYERFLKKIAQLLKLDSKGYIPGKEKWSDIFSVLYFYMKHQELSIHETSFFSKSTPEFVTPVFPIYYLRYLYFEKPGSWILLEHFFDLSEKDLQCFTHYLQYGKLRTCPFLEIQMTKREERLFHRFPRQSIRKFEQHAFRNYTLLSKIGVIVNDFTFLTLILHSDIFSFEQKIEAIIHNWKFWRPFFKFLGDHHNEIFPGSIGQMFDYTHYILKNSPAQVIPFSKMRLDRFKDRVKQWQDRILYETKYINVIWKSNPVNCKSIYKSGVLYKFKEITSAEALYEEGERMNHCVFRYIEDCVSGEYSFWSMRSVLGDKGVRRILTIQIHDGELKQAKGHSNRDMKEQEKGILKDWAEKNGLKMSI